MSTSLASKLAKHSLISGAPTTSASTAVRPNFSNLSMPAPGVLPMPMTFFTRS